MGSRSYLHLVAITICMITMVTSVSSQSCANVETYNAGLIQSVANADSRKGRIINALKNSDADFLCLQEVWMEEDVQDIVDGLSSTFPHHYSALHKSKDFIREPAPVSKLHAFFTMMRRWFHMSFKGDTACNGQETVTISTNVMVCGLLRGCLQKSGYALGRCITSNCGHILRRKSLRPSCVSCIFLNALNSLPDAISQCSVPTDRHNRLNGPGLLVLSKQDLGDVTYHNFFPDNRQMFERGYISAQLPNRLNSICTHLSSNVDEYLEYDLSHGGYEQQQAIEIGKLVGTGSEVIMGDMNTGPRVMGQSNPDKNLAGEFTDNFDTLISLGFRSPYTNSDGRCTYCSDNDLVEDYPNQVLDHVMVKNGVTTANENRLYDGQSPVLSDHYGIGMDVCWDRTVP